MAPEGFNGIVSDLTDRTLWIDARNGVAGDMLLGALIDAGAQLDEVQAAVDAVAPATVRLHARDIRRGGLRATKVDVDLIAADVPHRHWVDIRAMVASASLPDLTGDRVLAVFGRLARAEARAHGIPVDEVHFHEVGAWDSIADIVGCAAALGALGVDQITAGPVALGSGTVRTAHGELPVPVPAVLELSAGWRVVSGGDGELATPTGMALVTALATRCQELPEMTVLATGAGAGSRELAGRPNVVRVVIGTTTSASGRSASASGRPADRDPEGSHAVVLEANVDDLDPRVWPSVLATLLQTGAADAWLTPILMKKGRPAHTLSVLAPPDMASVLRDAIFRLVPTFGLRESLVSKTALARSWRAVDVGGAPVRIKLALADGVIVSATPEHDDVAAAAETLGLPVRQALTRAVAAAEAAGLTPGQAEPAPIQGS